MSKYFNGELLSAYEDLNKEFECKKENVKLHEQIADLEAKLAESEKRLVNCVDFDTWQKTAKENKELKQQLAEKEKEIETLKEENERNKAEAESQHKSFIDCFKDKMGLTLYYDNIEKQHNQDKISFVVEQLIETKEFADKQFNLDTCNLALARVLDKIDNQIKQLKEMK